MSAAFQLIDRFLPYIDRRVQSFRIKPGSTVVDYGCGPGRYTLPFSRLVGPEGCVYAVDVHELAIQRIKQKIEQAHLENIIPVQAKAYNSGLPNGVADVVCAIDVFFGVHEPTVFLQELKRITRRHGRLIIDDGHQSRETTLQKILDSTCWIIQEETRDHLICTPTAFSQGAGNERLKFRPNPDFDVYLSK